MNGDLFDVFEGGESWGQLRDDEALAREDLSLAVGGGNAQQKMIDPPLVVFLDDAGVRWFYQI